MRSRRSRGAVTGSRWMSRASMPRPPWRQEHNLPHAPTSFIGREKEIAEIKRLLGLHAPADAHRRGRLRQDPAGGCRWPRELLEDFPMASGWSNSPRSPIRLSCRRLWRAVLGLREQPGKTSLQTLIEHLGSKRLLAGAGQRRAPARCVRRTRRRLLRRCPHLVAARHQPGATGHRRRAHVSRAVVVDARSRRDRPRANRCVRVGAAVRRTGPAARPASRSRPERGGARVDLPSAGRHSAGDRAGRGARAVDVGGGAEPAPRSTASAC